MISLCFQRDEVDAQRYAPVVIPAAETPDHSLLDLRFSSRWQHHVMNTILLQERVGRAYRLLEGSDIVRVTDCQDRGKTNLREYPDEWRTRQWHLSGRRPAEWRRWLGHRRVPALSMLNII